MLKFIKNLSGHSGCKIYLFSNEKGKLFIRKKSSSVEYNLRLKKQFIKQKKYNLKIAKTPEIFGCGIEDNLFYFDMEYIPCITFSEYIGYIKIIDLIRYIKLLFLNLPIDESIKNFSANKIFKQKIDKLSTAIRHKNIILKQAFELLENNDWNNVLQSDSHGDLTLENIIISTNNEIYLIDFLDTFFSSWMIDVAKIFQDIETKWAFRNMNKDINRDIRLLIAKETLSEMILSLSNGKIFLLQIYKILLLNLIRIIPYTKDKNTKKFIYNALKNILKKINEMEVTL